MITFLFADAQIELVPPELHGAPSVKRRARERRRAPGELLLDQALDHKAMKALAEGDRRGRPDIAHFALLLVQDAPLREKRIFLHTRDDALVHVRKDLRPPRAQAKCYQLFEDLLRQGKVPMEAPLLWLEKDRPLARALDEVAKGPIVLLDEGGAPTRASDAAAFARAHEDLTIVAGAFPRGAWRGGRPRADHVWRVADAPVPLWSALVPVLAGLQDALPQRE